MCQGFFFCYHAHLCAYKARSKIINFSEPQWLSLLLYDKLEFHNFLTWRKTHPVKSTAFLQNTITSSQKLISSGHNTANKTHTQVAFRHQLLTSIRVNVKISRSIKKHVVPNGSHGLIWGNKNKKNIFVNAPGTGSSRGEASNIHHDIIRVELFPARVSRSDVTRHAGKHFERVQKFT